MTADAIKQIAEMQSEIENYKQYINLILAKIAAPHFPVFETGDDSINYILKKIGEMYEKIPKGEVVDKKTETKITITEYKHKLYATFNIDEQIRKIVREELSKLQK